MSLVLYGAPPSSFVRKADIVLREKGLEFESDPVNIMPMPDWFKAISPARRIPVLRNKAISEEGTLGTIPDSSPIFDYLEGELAGDQGSNGFLVGDSISVADAAVMSMLVQIELVAGVPDVSRWPLLVGFFEQMTARPSVQPTYAICKKIATKQFDLNA